MPSPRNRCGPARACLRTGKHPNLTGSYVNEVGLKPSENTIAKMMGTAGYETAHAGRLHPANNFRQGIVMARKPIRLQRMCGCSDYVMVSEGLALISHGYDGHISDRDGKRVDFIGYRTDCITYFAIHYLHDRRCEKPFFLFLSHIEPHRSAQGVSGVCG